MALFIIEPSNGLLINSGKTVIISTRMMILFSLFQVSSCKDKQQKPET
jgi:hypothetical protein